MAHLALALLGPFQATLDGLRVEGLSSPRLRALLAYLAVERGHEHPRELVASLLWPERPDREALSALRSALSNLHGALGDRRRGILQAVVTGACGGAGRGRRRIPEEMPRQDGESRQWGANGSLR